MPEGSSSAAPVTRPGPIFRKKRVTGFAFFCLPIHVSAVVDRRPAHNYLSSAASMASPVALVALPRFRLGPGVLTAVCRKRSSHVIHFLELPFRVAADVSLVALVRFHEFSFCAHAWNSHEA